MLSCRRSSWLTSCCAAVPGVQRGQKRKRSSTTDTTGAILLDVSDTETLLQKAWLKDAALLSLVFQAQGGGALHLAAPQATPDGPQDPDNPSDAAQRHAIAASGMFITRTVLVLPNKTRPVSELNGEKYENSHNIILRKVLQACLDIADMHGNVEAMRAQGAAVGDIVQRYMQHVKALQSHVRCRCLLRSAASAPVHS